MKSFLLTVTLIIYFSISFGQSWTSSSRIIGTDNIAEIQSVDDIFGNVYTLGHFVGTLNLPQGDLTSYGLRDYFITKFNQIGEVLWTNRIGGTGNEYIFGGITSDSNGDIYFLGGFRNEVFLDDSESLVSTGTLDICLAKYDSEGNLIWYKNIGAGAAPQMPITLAIDQSENLLLSGFFYDSIQFDINHTYYTDDSSPNYFFGKLNSDGEPIWINQMRLKNSTVPGIVLRITTNSDGYTFAGNFQDSVFFNNDTLVSESDYDVHIIRTDTDGAVQWVRLIHGDGGIYIYGLDYDDSNNIYIGGYYDSPSLQFDSTDNATTTIIGNNGDFDNYFAKYSNTGELQWIKTNGGIGTDKIFDLQYFSDEVHAVGLFSDVLNWGGIELSTAGIDDQDMLVGSIDIDGNYRSANSYAGRNSSSEEARNIFVYENELSTIIRSNSDLLILGDSIYTSDGSSFYIALGIIGCLPISVDQTIYNDVETCYGDSTGSILIAATGGFGGPWVYSIDNNATSSDMAFFENLPADDYQVVVIDAEGCTEIGPLVSLSQPDSLQAVLNSSNNIVIRDPRWSNDDGTITVVAEGGTGPYTYRMMPDGTPQAFGTFIIDSDDYVDVSEDDTLYYVIAVDDLNNCGPSLTDTIEVQVLTGFETKDGLEVNIYPNPTSGIVTIEMPYAEAECELEVLNMTGQMVLKKQVYSNGGVINETLDLSDQAKGLYMIRIGGEALQSAIMVK